MMWWSVEGPDPGACDWAPPGARLHGAREAGIPSAGHHLATKLLFFKIIGETWRPTMMWRIDQGEPITEDWRPVEHGLVATKGASANFAEALMLAKNRIVMRFGHSAATYTVVFTADGAAEAIGALNRCN